jgi:hypothetical protein
LVGVFYRDERADVSSPTGATACGWSGGGRRGLGWRLLRRAGRCLAAARCQIGRKRFRDGGLARGMPGRGRRRNGRHLPGGSGGATVQQRHHGWGVQRPWAVLGLLLDLPCGNLRHNFPPSPLLLRFPLARVLERLPRRVRVETLGVRRPKGVSTWRDSAPLCAEQAKERRGRGRGHAGVGGACGRASIVESTSIASLCGSSTAPPCRRDGDQIRCAAHGHERCGPRCEGGRWGAWGTGRSCESCEAILGGGALAHLRTRQPE